MKFLGVGLLSFFIPWHLAFAACVIQQSEQSSRLQTLEYADGRRFYFLGHTHGSRQLPEALAKLVRADQGSEIAFAQAFRALPVNPWALDQVSQDISLLRYFLADPKIDFVAMEGTPATVQNNLREYAHLRRGFQQAFEIRQVEPNESHVEVLRVALGPVAYLQSSEPELFSKKSILGFESEQAIAEESEAERGTAAARAILMQAVGGDTKTAGRISGLEFSLWSRLEDYVPERDETRVLEQAERSEVAAAVRVPALSWLRALLHEIAATKKRERAVVENMLGVARSGVLVMGQEHIDSVMRELRRQCVIAQKVRTAGL